VIRRTENGLREVSGSMRRSKRSGGTPRLVAYYGANRVVGVPGHAHNLPPMRERVLLAWHLLGRGLERYGLDFPVLF
jgi:hypothetical protein